MLGLRLAPRASARFRLWPLGLAALLLALAGCSSGRGSPTVTATAPPAGAPSAPAPTQAPAAPAATATPAGSSYTVKAGDTLSGIARSTGSTVEAIAGANHLQDPNKIAVGQKLVIPPSQPASAAGAANAAPKPAASSSALPPPTASSPPPP